jgi:hypothetical protein
MKGHFSSFGQYSIAEASIDESQINGYGGASAPVLAMNLNLDVSHGALKSNEGFEILSLEGKLLSNGVLLARSGPLPVHYILQHKFNTLKGQSHYLEFPLDANRLASIESKRAGGEVKFRLDLVLRVTKLQALNERPADQPMAAIVWGFVQTTQLYLQADLVVPRDVWVSRVLPNTGYGITHILEFPAASIESCNAIDHSFKALKQAEEKHKLGFYDDAAGKCRMAIEPFFDYEPVDPSHPESRKIPVLKKHWETKLGQATYDWLKNTLGSIKDASNPPHHSPTAHYSQFDSQMILAITTAVVAYIARTLKPEDLK